MKKTVLPFSIQEAYPKSKNLSHSAFYVFKTLSLKDIESIALHLIHTHEEFQVLRSAKINFKYFRNNQGGYFETFFSVPAKLNPFVKDQFTIYMNQNIAEALPIHYQAVEAIIAHELFHIVDYATKGVFALILLGLTYGAAYERETDFRVVKLGYTEGLIAYRQWLYNLLPDEKALEKKRKFYLTPEEMSEYLLQVKKKI